MLVDLQFYIYIDIVYTGFDSWDPKSFLGSKNLRGIVIKNWGLNTIQPPVGHEFPQMVVSLVRVPSPPHPQKIQV